MESVTTPNPNLLQIDIVNAKLTCPYQDELHILCDLLATSSRNGQFGHFITSL